MIPPRNVATDSKSRQHKVNTIVTDTKLIDFKLSNRIAYLPKYCSTTHARCVILLEGTYLYTCIQYVCTNKA